jgi:nitrogen fixation protein FixH
MNNKTMMIVAGAFVLIIGFLGFRVMSLSSTANNSEQVSLTTDPNPLRMGNANFIISVKDEKGQPVKNATVAFDLNMTAMNMGTQQGTATPQGDGTYAATGKLTMRGPWKVSTKITMPDGKLMNKDFTVEAQ